MKQICLIALLLMPLGALAQVSNPSIIPVASPPSGACTNGLPDQQTLITGVLYSCQSGTWNQLGGGGSGTVTSVSGTTNQIAVATGTTTPVLSLSTSIVLPGNLTVPTGSVLTPSGTGLVNANEINLVQMSVLATGILKNTTTTGAPSIAVAADFPTLNQNTTGTATNLSGTPALPNGTTCTTQTAGDTSGDCASDSFVSTAISNAIAAVNPAIAVLAASTANVTGTYTQVGGGIGDTFTVTATGAFTLDGIAINAIGQRVLLKNQTTASQNGMYTATVVGATAISPVFTRALDYDTPSDVNNTGSIPVQSGTVNTTTSWLLTSQVTSIGSAGSSLTYTQFTYGNATPLSALATQAADTVVQNASGSTAAPTAVAMPTCTTGADLYNTSTHAWSCVSTSGTASALVLLGTYTAANTSGSLTVVTRNASGQSGAIFQTDYNEYQIHFVRMLPATNAVTGAIQVSTNGGSTYDSTSGHYNGSLLFFAGTGSPAGEGSLSTTAIFLSGSTRKLSSTASNGGYSATYDWFDPLGASGFSTMTGNAMFFNTSDSAVVGATGNGAYLQSAAVNAFELNTSAGNWTSGSILVYGVAH